MKRTILYYSLYLLLSSALISCVGNNNASSETTRNDGDNTPISAEAEWTRSIASLQADDGGANNGRARGEVLEVLYTLRERLGTEGATPDVVGDLQIIRGVVERIYSSANARARGEWQPMSQDFAALESQLDNPDQDNLDQARQALNQIIARLGG
jgi:hypothetical protein